MKASTLIGVTTALAVALVGAGGGYAVHLAQKYKALDDQHQRCVQAMTDGPAAFLAVGKACDPAIASAQFAALSSAVCDQALSAKSENTAALRQVCSTAVKTVVAQRNVAIGERDAALGDLKTTRAGQAAAITRAEARIRTEAQRKIDAAQVVATAPRDADGLVVCDAVCLRRRAGETP